MRSVLKRVWLWFDDRTGLSKALGPIMRHPVPPKSGWMYVFGTATLFAFLVQVATGIALATAYNSSTGEAYKSLEWISHQATLGHLLRGMHYFGASAMILFVGIHMIRVFLTGSYKFPREVNWLSGVVLLALTLLMGFTGQLLRWDQGGVWSTIVAAEQAGRTPFIGHWLARFILGGQTVGGATLSRFFAFHVFFIPGLIFLVVGFHLYLVIQNGISEPPKAGRPVDPKTYRAWYQDLIQRRGVPFWPEAAWRDALFGAGVIAGIFVLGWFLGAPELKGPPDLTILKASPRPDWYLLWYFAIMAQLPHGSEAYLILLLPLLAAVVLILVPLVANRGERSPSRRPWSIAIVIMIVLSVGTFWVAGKHSPWSPDFDATPLHAQIIGSSNSEVVQGAKLFHEKACEYCHTIAGQGGQRGPDLTDVATRLTPEQMTIRILNGAKNMPAYAGSLQANELNAILAFLKTRDGMSR
ncbi:MAG: cytochrome b N-terminal domain-containing protein [Bryobacteraceae bacterium]